MVWEQSKKWREDGSLTEKQQGDKQQSELSVWGGMLVVLICRKTDSTSVFLNALSLCFLACQVERISLLKAVVGWIKRENLHKRALKIKHYRHRKQMCGFQGKKGMGGMNWEIGTDIYTLLCIIMRSNQLILEEINTLAKT